MPAFKDSRGNEWLIALDAPTIRNVREDCQVNLGETDGRVFDQFEQDPVLLVNVLWVMCREQAGTRGITDVTFGQSLVGDAIEHATKALTTAWLDFFPARKRLLLSSLAETQAALTEKRYELATAKAKDPTLIAQLMEMGEREMNDRLTQLLSAKNLPASSESTPPG